MIDIEKHFVIIEGKCVPKERPRVNMQTGEIYTPTKTLNYEAKVKLQTKMNIKKPLEKALKVKIIVEQKMPKSWSAKKKNAVISGEAIVLSVQDLDNMIKSITDGMNKVAYKDDRQIVKIEAEKRYSETDQVVVIIEEIGEIFGA